MTRLRSRSLVAVTLFGLGAYTSACDRPPPETVALPPVGMNVTGPYLADRNGALAFWGNGSLQLPVELNSGPVVITVTARGNTVDGKAPQLRVALGGLHVGTINVDSTIVTAYGVTATVESAGVTALTLSFDNYLRQLPPVRSRHLFIEMVTLRQPG